MLTNIDNVGNLCVNCEKLDGLDKNLLYRPCREIKCYDSPNLLPTTNSSSGFWHIPKSRKKETMNILHTRKVA